MTHQERRRHVRPRPVVRPRGGGDGVRGVGGQRPLLKGQLEAGHHRHQLMQMMGSNHFNLKRHRTNISIITYDKYYDNILITSHVNIFNKF